jgi:hypothetical protein
MPGVIPESQSMGRKDWPISARASYVSGFRVPKVRDVGGSFLTAEPAGMLLPRRWLHDNLQPPIHSFSGDAAIVVSLLAFRYCESRFQMQLCELVSSCPRCLRRLAGKLTLRRHIVAASIADGATKQTLLSRKEAFVLVAGSESNCVRSAKF